MIHTTAHVPAVRKVLLLLVAITSVLNVVACSALLGFQLTKTSGYQKPVPAILLVSFFSSIFSPLFLYNKIVSWAEGQISRFLRSIAIELSVLAGLAVITLAAVANLHADTPGLLESCGGYTICRMLTSVVALTWLLFLWLSLAFALLLLSSLYFTVRRKKAFPLHKTAFSEVEWDLYAEHSPRGIRRRNTKNTKGELRLSEIAVVSVNSAEKSPSPNECRLDMAGADMNEKHASNAVFERQEQSEGKEVTRDRLIGDTQGEDLMGDFDTRRKSITGSTAFNQEGTSTGKRVSFPKT